MFEPHKHFVLFVVDDPAACRRFYVEHFGFEVEIDIGWYVVLKLGSERPMGLGFLQADHPTQPERHRTPTSGSRFITFEVDDVDPIATQLVSAGLDIDVPLRDEPWGQRHLIVCDPAGNGVDIVQNIAGPSVRPPMVQDDVVSATLSIGEFSKLTHLSVKALRHYHDVGLLVPAAVDSESRYRRYDTSQTRDAQLIRRLRALDMPIDAIRGVIKAADADARDTAIAAHLAHMEDELVRTQEVVASLRALLAEPQLDVGVERRRLDDVLALAIRFEVTRQHVESWCGAAFGELRSAIDENDAEVIGPGGGLFSAAFFADDDGPVVAYIPVAAAPPSLPGRVEVVDVGGGDVLVGTHAGPFEDLDRTYAVLGAAANELGIAVDGAIRELYVVGPDVTDDPLRFRTEVCWPITSD